MNDTIQLLARALLSTVFIVFGFQQFTNIAGYTANPNIVKFSGMVGGILAPVVIAYLVAAVDLFGGLLVLVGYKNSLRGNRVDCFRDPDAFYRA